MDYRTQANDTMSSIAAKFHVSLAELEAANPQIADPSRIFPNEIVHVPGASGQHPTSVPPHVATYIVQPGDIKSGIAAAHGLSEAALEAANPQIPNPNLIVPGQVINIPGSGGHGQPQQSHAGDPPPPPSGEGRLTIDQVTYAHFQGGGDVTSWITGACAALGVPAAGWIAGYVTLCQRESSGRPNVANGTDGNAHGPLQSDGYPLHCSRGVAQCIPDTFARYHAAGTSTGIYDPVANIAASMRYVMSVYGVVSDGSNLTHKVQQADSNRSPQGY